MKIRALALMLLGLSAASGCASSAGSARPPGSGSGAGVEVKVYVVDPATKPVATAVVREPREQDRHRVNAEDGSWKASSLYLPDGTEIQFTAGQELSLEVSAPGYQTEVVVYTVRKSRNIVQVALQPIEMSDDSMEEPIITFKQDKPRETTGDQ